MEHTESVMAAMSTAMTQAAPAWRCWVITDGTKGMEVQSCGLAEAMDLATRRILLEPPALLRHCPRLGRIPVIDRLLLPAMISEIAEQHGWPDLLIATGRRMAGLSIAIRSVARSAGAGTRTIQIQDPRLPAQLFDRLVIPSHDRLRAENILLSTGSLGQPQRKISSTTDIASAQPSQADTQQQTAITALPRPRILVLIGGSNRRYAVVAADINRLAERLADIAERCSASLIILPSRRSPPQTAAILAEHLTGQSAYIWDQDQNHTNPYPLVLQDADAIIVTSDSVNMTSEACSTGKPVFTYAIRQETGRIGRFHAQMQQAGHSRMLPDSASPANIFASPAAAPLDETRRIASLLLEWLESSGEKTG